MALESGAFVMEERDPERAADYRVGAEFCYSLSLAVAAEARALAAAVAHASAN